jgi:hypothetical protein
MLVNIIGFNVSWLGLVLLGNSFIPVTLAWLAFHLYLSKHWRDELAIICFVTAIGIFVDSTLIWLDVFYFAGHNVMPPWLITLWAALGATIFNSLKFLQSSKFLQCAIGFIFPAFSYITGASLSAVELPYGHLITYFVLAPIWALLLVLIYRTSTYIKGKGDNNAY